jgi:peptidoglycan/xylan/chitin deacetylase (PgdA/CDA1 family)
MVLVAVALVVVTAGLLLSGSKIEQIGAGASVIGGVIRSESPASRLPSTLPPDAVAVHVPILMYHYVDDTPPPAGPYADDLTVRTKDFVAEMEFLVDGGYHTVSLADVYLAMAGERELPAKPVVLTFDDGGLDNYQVAFPILKQHGLVATFFVITGSVGKAGQMDWDELGEMAAQGMSIQSHTVSHPDLRGVSGARLKSELGDSCQAVAEASGEPSYVLCYPSGAYNDTVIEAAKAAGYAMAVTTSQGEGGDPAAVFEMKRRRVQAFTTIESFARLVQ